VRIEQQRGIVVVERRVEHAGFQVFVGQRTFVVECRRQLLRELCNGQGLVASLEGDRTAPVVGPRRRRR
jgi:hypothetical protein